MKNSTKENFQVAGIVLFILLFFGLIFFAAITSPTFAEECKDDGGTFYDVQGYQACDINGVVIRNDGE